MWHMFLNHFWDSEAESGVLSSIRPIPDSKYAKQMFENCQKVPRFHIFETGSVANVFRSNHQVSGAENDSGIRFKSQHNPILKQNK